MAIKNGKIVKSENQNTMSKTEKTTQEKDNFLDEMKQPVKKVETTTNQTPDADEWEKQDLGVFEFHNFVDSQDGKTKGEPVFIGTYLGKIWFGEESDNQHNLKGIHFHDNFGNLILVPTNYALANYFQNAEAGKKYKIVFIGYKQKAGGGNVSQFEIFKGK